MIASFIARSPRVSRTWCVSVFSALVIAWPGAAPAAAQVVRVSVATDGTQADDDSFNGLVSGNGRFVAFQTAASNLVAGDTNSATDVFVRDLFSSTTTRVSVATGGGQIAGASGLGGISDDGNIIVFQTTAAVVAEDTNQCTAGLVTTGCNDVYVHDRTTGQTTRVSVASNGTQGNGNSSAPTISGDGRYVVFTSSASNLIAGDTNGESDVFLRDREMQTTTRVSVAANGQQGARPSFGGVISKDGRAIGFLSDRLNFGPSPDTQVCAAGDDCVRAYVRTQATGALVALPVVEATPIPVQTTGVSVSNDGRYAVATTLARTGHHAFPQANVFEVAGVKLLTTLQVAGTIALSADGRYVTGTNVGVTEILDPVPPPPEPVRIFDRVSGLTDYFPSQFATPQAVLVPTSFDSTGRFLVLATSDATLVAGDTNSKADIFIVDRDPDGDGIPSFWETRFGLEPNNPMDATADPDGDGQMNFEEYQANTLPNGLHRRYFAEGAANAFFATRIAVVNPGDVAADVAVQLFGANGQTSSQIASIAPKSRRTFALNDAVLPDSVFSSVIESSLPVVADRLMTWDARGYGSHLESSIAAPGTAWYLAEGATGGPYSLYYLLQNPGAADASATVTYLRPSPLPPIVKTYTVSAHSRETIDVRGEHAGLASAEVSASITSDLPLVVERALYYSTPTQPMAAGHDGAGIAAPAPRWFLAEGATGFFDEYVLIANPDEAQDANVKVTYLLEDGVSLSEPIVVKKQSRFTLDLKARGFAQLKATPVSVVIESTNGVPVVAERVMWWPHGSWYEASLSAGTTMTGTRWVVAEGEQGGTQAASTYVLIANTDTVDGTAKVTLLYEGLPPEEKTFTVKAQSRKSIDIGAEFPNASGQRFGAIVESNGIQIVVERALYASPNGVLFDAGATSVATMIAPVP